MNFILLLFGCKLRVLLSHCQWCNPTTCSTTAPLSYLTQYSPSPPLPFLHPALKMELFEVWEVHLAYWARCILLKNSFLSPLFEHRPELFKWKSPITFYLPSMILIKRFKKTRNYTAYFVQPILRYGCYIVGTEPRRMFVSAFWFWITGVISSTQTGHIIFFFRKLLQLSSTVWSVLIGDIYPNSGRTLLWKWRRTSSLLGAQNRAIQSVINFPTKSWTVMKAAETPHMLISTGCQSLACSWSRTVEIR